MATIGEFDAMSCEASGKVLRFLSRKAFHDSATHDAVKGTGGLDASIAFELDREEVSFRRSGNVQVNLLNPLSAERRDGYAPHA